MSAASPVSILIVDDERLHLEALCDTLRDEGYAPQGFTSPAQALQALRKGEFSLLLTDLRMAELDGITLLRVALGIDPDLATVVMTGHGTIDSAVAAMKAGALDYIQKPFDLTVVLPVLARALTIRQLRLENAALQKRVREQVAELEAANQELESFAYSISHDLRSPLRHIDGYIQLYLEDAASRLQESDRKQLAVVQRGAARMTILIDGLLNLARLGCRPLSKQDVDLNQLVGQVLEELPEDREGREVELTVGDLPGCNGDPALLKQVMANLIGNAFKFTSQRERASILVSWQEQAGDTVYFVRDNGAGFDMRYAKKLFAPFQRMHRADQFNGTGVGLSIVQRIIHRHGGRVWAEAELDKGATFYFVLPV